VEELQEEDAVKEQCTCNPTPASTSAQGRSNVYSQLSGLEGVVFNDLIKDDFIPECDNQVLEKLGEYKCDVGVSVDNVSAVKIKTLKGRFIAHKFSTG
jgi:hypothetical protein